MISHSKKLKTYVPTTIALGSGHIYDWSDLAIPRKWMIHPGIAWECGREPDLKWLFWTLRELEKFMPEYCPILETEYLPNFLVILSGLIAL